MGLGKFFGLVRGDHRRVGAEQAYGQQEQAVCLASVLKDRYANQQAGESAMIALASEGRATGK
jgi:hypothetical protein